MTCGLPNNLLYNYAVIKLVSLDEIVKSVFYNRLGNFKLTITHVSALFSKNDDDN